MSVIVIAAVDLNNGIGFENKLPWHYKEDLKLFKKFTINHAVIMGRKTMDSIGKPLPSRENLVLSKQNINTYNSCLVFNDLIDAIEFAKQKHSHIFIIGGAEIFKQGLDICDKIYLTKINKTFKTDVKFPEIPPEFKVVSSEEITIDLKLEVLTRTRQFPT